MRVLVTVAALLGASVLAAWSFFDPYNRHSIATGCIILGTGGAVFAAFLAFRCRISTAMITTAIVVLGMTIGWQASAPSISRLEELAEPTIQALSDYHDQSSRYPDSLEALEITPPTTRFGEYHYEAENGGRNFTLTIGDYGLDLFVGVYVSADNRWHWDT